MFFVTLTPHGKVWRKQLHLIFDKYTVHRNNFPVEVPCLILSARGNLGRQQSMGSEDETAGATAGGRASLALKHIVVPHESFGRY